MPYASRSFSRFARALLYRAGPAYPPVLQANHGRRLPTREKIPKRSSGIRAVSGGFEKHFPGPEKITRKGPRKAFGPEKFSGLLRNARLQDGKRPGGETGSPLLGQCVMRRRTGTSAPSALPVQLMAAKNLLSTNRK